MLPLCRYTYEVHKNKEYNIPLHMVEIVLPYYVGISVFNSAKEAKEFITEEKMDAENRGYELLYDADMSIISAPYFTNMTTLYSKLENHQIYGY